MEEQWQQLDHAKDIGVLESAPDDEIMADIVACQSELLQQSATNRVRLKKTLEEMLEQRPSLMKELAHKERMEHDILECTKAITDNRRDKQRERRELSRKRNSERAGVGSHALVLSPRRSCPPRSFYPEQHIPHTNTTPKLHQFSDFSEKMVDPLAVRDVNGGVVCAVCGQSHCSSSNRFIFCGQCDIAVHQECYGVADVPESDWLCCPCMMYKEKQKKDSASVENMGGSHEGGNLSESDRKAKGGGSRMVDCALCPVKWGAFKLSTDKQRWVHVVRLLVGMNKTDLRNLAHHTGS